MPDSGPGRLPTSFGARRSPTRAPRNRRPLRSGPTVTASTPPDPATTTFVSPAGGGGGEVFPWKRLGLGFDGGYYKFHEDTNFGLATFNVALYLGDPSSGSRVDPFLSVSPGFYWSEDQAGGAFGVGGGLDFWLKDRVGLRGKLRLHALGTEEGLFLFRIGAAFR